MNIIYEIAAIGISFVLGFIVSRYGNQYFIFKGKLKAVSELLLKISEGLEDDKVTSEEIEEIVEAINRLCE